MLGYISWAWENLSCCHFGESINSCWLSRVVYNESTVGYNNFLSGSCRVYLTFCCCSLDYGLHHMGIWLLTLTFFSSFHFNIENHHSLLFMDYNHPSRIKTLQRKYLFASLEKVHLNIWANEHVHLSISISFPAEIIDVFQIMFLGSFLLRRKGAGGSTS